MQLLIGGESGGICVNDLKMNTTYNDFSAEDPIIVAFWEVVAELSIENQSRLLMFVTACSRPPLLVII